MCGRFTLRTPASVLVERFQLRLPLELTPRFNIAPTQPVAAVRLDIDSRNRELTYLRWGLIPSWAKDPKIGNRMINARAETVATKPSFRSAFRSRRCLIVADGYYEWQKRGSQKQPFHIRMWDERPFAMAGLWEIWQDPQGSNGGSATKSCTIITTSANELTRSVHDRMPVILREPDWNAWLDTTNEDTEQLELMLRPHDSASMTVDAVSTYVNSPKNDDPKCLEGLAS